MTLKSILALADGTDLHGLLSAAVGLTARLSGRLDVLHIKTASSDMIAVGVEGMTGDMIDEITRAARKPIEDRCARAKAEYDRTCAESGQPVHWREVVGRPGKRLSIASRFADLLVLAQPERGSSGTLLEAVDTAIFESGRPVVFIPANVPSAIGNRIMVAWNGSTQAALAVSAALPLLRRAALVDIVQIGDIGKDAPSSDLALYLALHGIKASIHAIDFGVREIGGALIDAADRCDCDLIVMGAYGHSRLRERILGGATRDLLANSSWPLLMRH